MGHLTLTTLEHAAEHHGLHTWPSSTVLAHWLLGQADALSTYRLLELGCGTGLCGLTAAALGARVTLSDAADSPEVLSNAAAAAALNALQVDLLPLSWGVFTPELASACAFDLLIGADVFYDSAAFDALLATVAFLLRRGPPHARFVCAYQHRSGHASLPWRLRCFGLSCAGVTSAEAVLGASADLPGVTIEVVELRLDRKTEHS